MSFRKKFWAHAPLFLVSVEKRNLMTLFWNFDWIQTKTKKTLIPDRPDTKIQRYGGIMFNHLRLFTESHLNGFFTSWFETICLFRLSLPEKKSCCKIHMEIVSFLHGLRQYVYKDLFQKIYSNKLHIWMVVFLHALFKQYVHSSDLLRKFLSQQAKLFFESKAVTTALKDLFSSTNITCLFI